MSDDFDIIHLNQDDAQEVINWAVSTAAMIVLMENAPEHSNDEEGIQRLEGYIEAVNLMINNMPDILVGPANIIAAESVEEAIEEEEQVEQFREELKDL